MNDFILEFERLYNHIKQKVMTLPEILLVFKLLDASKIPHHNRQLVLTGVDYQQNINLVKILMKIFLCKFNGGQ